MTVRFLGALLLLAGCFGGGETPFEEGLEPLETMAVEPPADLAETFELVTAEGDEFKWGHLRGYIHADMPTVWSAYQDADVVVDRRRVAEWTPRLDVEEGYDYSMAIDQVVEDTITVEYTITWRHGAVGDIEDPEKVSMRWQKTDGFGLIEILRGSVALLPTDDPNITEVQMIEHLQAPLTDLEEIEGLLTDVYADAVAFSHGEALQEFGEE